MTSFFLTIKVNNNKSKVKNGLASLRSEFRETNNSSSSNDRHSNYEASLSSQSSSQSSTSADNTSNNGVSDAEKKNAVNYLSTQSMFESSLSEEMAIFDFTTSSSSTNKVIITFSFHSFSINVLFLAKLKSSCNKCVPGFCYGEVKRIY